MLVGSADDYLLLAEYTGSHCDGDESNLTRQSKERKGTSIHEEIKLRKQEELGPEAP
jgi:hypothetical protein